MDGNRRFATEQGKVTLEGHTKGLETFIESVKFVRDKHIPHAVYYAFSTENWKRSEQEVTYLLELFKHTIQRLSDELVSAEGGSTIKVRFIGQRKDFPADLQTEMELLEAKNEQHPDAKTTIWIALSYGGRAELIEAVNTAITRGEPVDENSFKALLWTADLPDPDIIVRTSGEQRLSNFSTWGGVYSELYFIKKHWPALTQADFEDILQEYATRERRQGA
jgi:undecaprenyl diphosphate synthase